MAGERDKKSYKIGEVCRMADVQPYVLRYWETEFPPLAPEKTGGGQRTYSQREIDVILRIKQLLYGEGFTIAGAKKKLEAELGEDGELTRTEPAAAAAPAQPAAAPAARKNQAKKLAAIRNELTAILDMLR